MNNDLKILSVDLAKKNKENKESPLENNNDLKVFIINGSGGSIMLKVFILLLLLNNGLQ